MADKLLRRLGITGPTGNPFPTASDEVLRKFRPPGQNALEQMGLGIGVGLGAFARPSVPASAMLWSDGTPMLWSDGTYMLWSAA